MSSAKAKGIAAIAAVFLLGAIAGAGGAYAFGQRRMAELIGDERGELRDRRRLDALSRKLDLTEEQRMRVGEALRSQRAARHRAMAGMFEECGDELRTLRRQLESDINAVLSPEQQERFAEITRRHRERFLHRRKGHGRRPFGHPRGAGPDGPRGPAPGERPVTPGK